MAPTVDVPQSGRTTRSSTRSQTQKAQKNNSITKPLKAKNTGKVDKKSAKARNKGSTKGPKKTTESKPKPNENEDNEPAAPSVDKHPSISPLPFIKPFTITSELVNKPILCHKYSEGDSKIPPPPPKTIPTFIFTHGAGGTLSAPPSSTSAPVSRPAIVDVSLCSRVLRTWAHG